MLRTKLIAAAFAAATIGSTLTLAGTASATTNGNYQCAPSTVPVAIVSELGNEWAGNAQPAQAKYLYGDTFAFGWATADASCTNWTFHYVIGSAYSGLVAARAEGFPA